MSDTTRIRIYKYKNIAAALAVLLLILVALSTSCGAKGGSKKETKNKAYAADSSVAENDTEDVSDSKRLTKYYVYKEMQNGTALYNGLLLNVDSSHPFTGQINNAEALYSFMFDKDGEQILAAGYPSDEALPEMLKALNTLAVDFKKESGLNTLMVSSLVPQEEGDKTDEAYIGSCADLMLYDYFNGSFDSFTGTDEYSWIPNNCYKYGFIMRGNDRLRYVGTEAAAYIRYLSVTEGQADLEKLQTTVKNYSFEEPLYFVSDDETEYAAYFVPVESGSITTSVPIPTREDETEYTHFISGNNEDGYIVFVNLSENTGFDDYYEKTDDSSSDLEID